MKRYIKASTYNQDRDKLYALAEEMAKVLNDAHIWADLEDYDYYEDLPVAQITFSIRGDWKHDHLRADYLIRENFPCMPRIDKVTTESDGSDYYTGTHTYYIPMR